MVIKPKNYNKPIHNIELKEKENDKYFFTNNGKFYGKHSLNELFKMLKTAGNSPVSNFHIEKIRLIYKYEDDINNEFKKIFKDAPKVKINETHDKKCIYCKEIKIKNKEHIIQKGFVQNNHDKIILKYCVCVSCNDYFKCIDQYLLQVTPAGRRRYDFGIKSRDEIIEIYQNNEGEKFDVNRKTDIVTDKSGKKISDSNDLYQEYTQMGPILDAANNREFRAITKDLFNFATKYIGYDEVMKPEWDLVRNFIRYNKNSGKISKNGINKLFYPIKGSDPILLNNGISLRIENSNNDFVGYVKIFDYDQIYMIPLVKDYNIKNFKSISLFMEPKKEPYFY